MDTDHLRPLMSDSNDDAALALRLQAEEMGIDMNEAEAKQFVEQSVRPQFSYTSTNNNSSNDARDDFSLPRTGSRSRRASSMNNAANVNPSVQVRRNAIDASMQARPRHSSFLSWLFLAYAIAELSTSITMLSLYWHNSCDSPINIWILVYTLRYAIYIPFDIISQRYQRRNTIAGVEYEPPLLELKINSLIKYAVFVWFVVGLYWVISAHQCSSNPLFTLAIVLLSLYGVRLVYPLVVLALICLCLPCALLLLRQMSTSPQGADRAQIDALPIRTYESQRSLSANGVDDCSDDPSCSICLQEYRQGEELRVLPHCRPRPHMFHRQCCDTWLETNASCPLCRTSITEEGRAEQERERQEEARREEEHRSSPEHNEDDDNASYPPDYQSTRQRDAVDVV